VDSNIGEETAELIRSRGGECIFVEADVSKGRDVKKMVGRAVEVYGRIDVMFNNAGVGLYKPLFETTEEDWDRVIDVNLKGAFLGCRSAANQMLKQGGGVIVNTASEIGLVGAKNYSAYCASKGGIIQLTRALAVELADGNIRVNCLCPGVTMTSMLKRSMESTQNPEERRRALEQGVPLKRIADPNEIARGALFLASDDSSFMTGSVMVMDGGATAG